MSLSPDQKGGLSVFNYLNYREFLKAFYEAQKSKRPGYSFRVFALRAKLSSQNYLKLVMDGKRRITDKMLPSFIRGLGLSSEEAKYFRLMVLFNEATDPNEKRDLLSKMVTKRNQNMNRAQTLLKSQEQVLSHWSHWVIRELILLDSFQEDPVWISQELKQDVSPDQARESLDLLLQVGLIERKDGKLIQSNPRISTEDEIVSALIRELHSQFIERGTRSLFQDPMTEREFAGLTISLSKGQIPKFKEKIKKFRQELNAEFSCEGKELSRVYHLELMFFPITKGGRKC